MNRLHIPSIRSKHKILVIACCCVVLIVIVFGIISLKRQTEGRAYMLNVYFALLIYARDHQGKFPQSDVNSYHALQKLYPDYCSSAELSGLSGNVKFVEASLKALV